MIKILMIDDENSAIHAFLDKIMDDMDVQYHFLKDNVNEVLNYLKNNNVDGVFLDIRMPSINGFDLGKKIVSLYPSIKIVFATGTSTTEEDIPAELKDNVIGIMYKPFNERDLRHYLKILSNQATKMKVIMFNNYDCFINGKVVNFSSKKSKELFALLLVNRGKTVMMDHAITCLWPDKDIDKSKILYRDAVWRLRQVLDTYKFPCVNFGRAQLWLNTDNIICDYYDYLDGKDEKKDLYFLLKEYDWIDEYI